eukprot:150074-Pyramimonas_sp.AAC.1
MSMRHFWVTDCKNLEDNCIAPAMGKTEDQRLNIDLSSLRQAIWINGTAENMPTDFLVEILRASPCDVIPDPESTLKK